MLEIPTCAFDKSFSVSPVAYSIACEAPWEIGCVTCRETSFKALSLGGAEDEEELRYERAGSERLVNRGRVSFGHSSFTYFVALWSYSRGIQRMEKSP